MSDTLPAKVMPVCLLPSRIPQFKPIGVPTMGAYRELRKLPRGVSIASELDERVEDVRAAADGGDFDLYIAA